jgi:ABC-type glycerol-3-phosphate transport system permease component
MKIKTLISNYWRTVLLAVITIITLFPLVLVIFTSLKPVGEIATATPSLFPNHITLDNFTKLFSLINFRAYLLNSLLVSGLTSMSSIAIASMATYALVWMKLPGKRIISRSLFATYMFPSVLSAIPLFMVCYEMNLIDNRLMLVFIYLAFDVPFSIWLLKSSVESIPSGLVEAARLDGCSDWQCLWKLVFPLSLPFVLTAGALSFVLSWNEYLVASTLMTSDVTRTLSVGLQAMIGNYHVDYGLLTAAGVVILVPVLVLFLLAHRYLLQGFAVGGLKE